MAHDNDLSSRINDALWDFRESKEWRFIELTIPLARDVNPAHCVTPVRDAVRVYQIHVIDFEVSSTHVKGGDGRDVPVVIIRLSFPRDMGVDVTRTYIDMVFRQAAPHVSLNGVQPLRIDTFDPSETQRFAVAT